MKINAKVAIIGVSSNVSAKNGKTYHNVLVSADGTVVSLSCNQPVFEQAAKLAMDAKTYSVVITPRVYKTDVQGLELVSFA